jgi:ATP-dependent exoDNAse (exonuclease V) beta subunit
MSAVNFTSAQLEAIQVLAEPLDTCVVAGPGSGKTTVLVEYFANLVESGIDPLRILAITFTEKAAANMRSKLLRKFQDEPEIRAKLERAWVDTIHGFCSRLLHEQAVAAGVDPEFTIALEQDSIRLQRESLNAAMEEAFARDTAGVRALIRGLSSPEFEELIRSAYDALRSAGRGLDPLFLAPPSRVARGDLQALLRKVLAAPLSSWEYKHKVHLEEALGSARRIIDAASPREALVEIEEFPLNLQKCKRNTEACDAAKQLKLAIEDYPYTLITELYAPQRSLLIEIVRSFDRIYRERKRRLGVLDFSDLEEHAVRLLETNPEAQARLRAQFDHVLMDEFQDTNPQQANLARLARPPERFYAVGDINQSIYGFRHADPEGFREYREEVRNVGGRVVELGDNFRSRPEILSAVETVTAGCAGIEQRSLVAGRTFTDSPEYAVEILGVTGGADDSQRIEAKWVARRILELAASECEFRDIAMLVRNTEVLSDFTPAFDEAGIPYLVNRGKGFYETREVNDLVHLLRVIDNPRDEISLGAVLRSPLAAVSDDSLLQLRMLGSNIGGALWRVGPENAPGFGDDYERLLHFRRRLHDWRARREYVSFDQLLLDAMDECGYRPETGARGAANIDKLLAQARAAEGMTLGQFVSELEQIRESNPQEPDAAPEDAGNAVKIMTVHAAKGLEFPVVFVAAMHKGTRKDLGPVAFSPGIGLGARWRNPAARGDKGDLYELAIRQERKLREENESHRLLYVAMTRAEKRLVMSFSGKKLDNWSKLACEALELDAEVCREEIEECTAPDGKQWNLRVTITDKAPEPLPAPAQTDADESQRVELLAAPALTAQQDANATVTALAKFAKCPREYYLGQYLGFEGGRRAAPEEEEDASESDVPADEFGRQVHALLAGLPVEAPSREVQKLAQVFRESALGKRAAKATRVEREFSFLMAVEDLVIRGQVDLWFEEGGELVVVDYKTDAVTVVEAHQRAQDYELQLKLYALAVERVTGRAPKRAWLHFLRPDVAIEVDLTPALLDTPEQIARDFQDAQDALRFPMRIAAHCRRCQFYRDQCPAE